MTANYITATEVLRECREGVYSGKPKPRIHMGAGGMAEIQVAPKQVTLFGGAPNAGKTALIMQNVTDALRLMPDLRALVCNVEMTPEVLHERQLSRLSGVPLTNIIDRNLNHTHTERLEEGFETLESIADRMCYMEAPYSLENVANTYDEFGAGLIVLDYIQRFQPIEKVDQDRQRMNSCMDTLRKFASAGAAVIVVSAVGRTKDNKGRSSYSGSGLTLASFRESSELEFGADDAYILHPDGDDENGDDMRLRHLKSRHAARKDLLLDFNRSCQRFTPEESIEPSPAQRAANEADLAAAWAEAEEADDE